MHPDLRDGVKKSIHFFSPKSIVMLHIKLKGMGHRAPCKQIICPYIHWPLEWGLIKHFANVISRWQKLPLYSSLTLKERLTIAADDKFWDIFPNFRKKIRYEISWELSASRQFSWNIMPYMLFLKKRQNLKICRLLQIIGGALWV